MTSQFVSSETVQGYITYSISRLQWIAIAVSVLFIAGFLFVRMKNAQALYGTKNIVIDYKQNQLKYMSALLVLGGILSITASVEMFNTYRMYKELIGAQFANVLCLSSVVLNVIMTVSIAIFAYAVLNVFRNRALVSMALALYAFSFVAAFLVNLFLRDASIESLGFNWTTVVEAVSLFALAALYMMRKNSKIIKALAVAIFAFVVILWIVSVCRNIGNIYNNSGKIMNIIRCVIAQIIGFFPTLTFYFVTMRLFV